MEERWEKRSDDERYSRHSSRERRIAQLARRQHGVVALWQLLSLGISASAARHRVAAGRWHRVHAGVFATGHAPLTRDGHRMAAVLACGPGSALSHRSAADKLGLRRSSRSAIDVTAPRQRGRGRDGIQAHSSRTLLPRDIVLVDAIPCTSVARTLLDLAAVAPRRAVERAIDEAERLRLLDVRPIEDVLARAGGHPGARILGAVLHEHASGSTPTRNKLEERFLAICRSAGVPQPEVNTWIALEPTGYEADFLWRPQRLIVETDGREAHLTRHAFEHDRRRDQRLMLAGWRVARVTWRQLLDEPAVVETTIRAPLAQAPASVR